MRLLDKSAQRVSSIAAAGGRIQRSASLASREGLCLGETRRSAVIPDPLRPFVPTNDGKFSRAERNARHLRDVVIAGPARRSPRFDRAVLEVAGQEWSSLAHLRQHVLAGTARSPAASAPRPQMSLGMLAP